MNFYPVPSFDEQLSDLHGFIIRLVEAYYAGQVHSWATLEEQVVSFFTEEQMNRLEACVPGWRKMASYQDGVTLTHVLCAFLGLYMMPDFLSLDREQRDMMKWVILLHDIEKEPQPKQRDHSHAFRSTVWAAQILPTFGFVPAPEYEAIRGPWSELTCSATTVHTVTCEVVQDNGKLPPILDGIDRMFGRNTPAALILKTILFHLSINMKEWPPPNPLTKQEEKQYLDQDLLPLLRVMSLADTDGWSLFDSSSRERLRADTISVFQELASATPR